MPIIEHSPTLNIPSTCQSARDVSAVLDGAKTAVLDAWLVKHEQDLNEYVVQGCSVKVAQRMCEVVNREWLERPLGSGIACYVPVCGGVAWLPLSLPSLWIVQAADAPAPRSDAEAEDTYFFARVEYQDERCLAELCCNAWKYLFDVERGMFVRHAHPEWNAIKGLLRKYILPLTGGTDERVADYGRLILFLLNRANLTETERAALAPLLEVAPEVADLAGVVRREALVQQFVAEAKRNPAAFLAWGEDWTRYWWKAAGEEKA